jgi:hypothetical protein
VVVAHPVDAGDHAAPGAGAVAVQHPHRHQVHPLGHAVVGAAHGPGDVRAVPVAVLPVVPVADYVVADAGAAAELPVRGLDAGVEDVHGDAGAGEAVVVGAVQGKVALVHPVQPPAGGLHRPDPLVLLHVRHLGVALQGFGRGRGQRGREALDGVPVRVVDRAAVRGRELLRQPRGVLHLVVEDHHVPVGDRLGGATPLLLRRRCGRRRVGRAGRVGARREPGGEGQGRKEPAREHLPTLHALRVNHVPPAASRSSSRGRVGRSGSRPGASRFERSPTTARGLFADLFSVTTFLNGK